uniref:Ig-like domain-containing protein n=1 Tax=Takifugu rubripes TaxID=31033 RepID=A0A674NZM0_TAKRU
KPAHKRLLWFVSSETVQDEPPSTFLEGDALVSGINCSHQVSSFQVILWYKQDESRALKLLGYLYTNNQNVEEDVKGKISFDGDGRSGSSLSIAAVGLKDSGVYFCSNLEFQLLGYMFLNEPNVEKGGGVTIEGDANKNKTCTLIIDSLSVNSSGVYFLTAETLNTQTVQI